jgi:hypothetical protein
VDAKSGTIQVLGRTYQLPTSSKTFALIEQASSGGRLVQVAVVAKLGNDGAMKEASLKILPDEYVAGVSEVITSGRIKSVDSATGKAVVGGSLVDFVSLLSTHPVTLTKGDVAILRGTQPTLGGVVLVNRLIGSGL